MHDPSRPPRITWPRGTTPLVLFAILFAVVVLLDLAGAVALGLGGESLRFVSLAKMGRIVARLIEQPSVPARAWSTTVPAHFAATTFWAVFGLIVVAGGLLVAAALRLCGRKARRRAGEGYASKVSLEHLATVRAARRRAAQTRPSLVVSLPSTFGRKRLSKLSQADVGYPLGITRRPKGVRLVASWETSLRLVAPPGEGKTERLSLIHI